jgi:hypothetical protein
MTRTHNVKVTLSDRELAQLDERRGITARAVYPRRLLYEPPSPSEVASHEEALGLMSRQAREGSISAAVALERALRHEDHGGIDNDLARLLSD